MFGDMLSTIMKEDKGKKRRMSDIKAEKEAKVRAVLLLYIIFFLSEKSSRY